MSVRVEIMIPFYPVSLVHILIYYDVCERVQVLACHNAHMEVRGQLEGGDYLLRVSGIIHFQSWQKHAYPRSHLVYLSIAFSAQN